MIKWPKYPSERENLEISIEMEQKQSVSERFRSILELIDLGGSMNTKPHPFDERDEAIWAEAYQGWIRRHRGR
jgi:hypothetical protein